MNIREPVRPNACFELKNVPLSLEFRPFLRGEPLNEQLTCMGKLRRRQLAGHRTAWSVVKEVELAGFHAAKGSDSSSACPGPSESSAGVSGTGVEI